GDRGWARCAEAWGASSGGRVGVVSNRQGAGSSSHAPDATSRSLVPPYRYLHGIRDWSEPRRSRRECSGGCGRTRRLRGLHREAERVEGGVVADREEEGVVTPGEARTRRVDQFKVEDISATRRQRWVVPEQAAWVCITGVLGRHGRDRA